MSSLSAINDQNSSESAVGPSQLLTCNRATSPPLQQQHSSTANGCTYTSLSAQSASPTRPTNPHDTNRSTSRSSAKPKAKRRRLDADLGFSSPGPAFTLGSVSLSVDDRDGPSSGSAPDSMPIAGRSLRSRRKVSLVADSLDSSSMPQQSPTVPKSPMSDHADASICFPVNQSDPFNPPIAHINGTANATRPRSASSSSFLSQESASFSSDEDPFLQPVISEQPIPRPATPPSYLTSELPFPERLAKHKQAKLDMSQAQLEQIHDNHDMLVRELFHLTKFVTMIGYDPEVAKQDRSHVFSEFAQAYDLKRLIIDSSAAGPSASSGRVTRRGINARLESLSLKRLQQDSPTQSAPATPSANDTPRRPSRRVSALVEDPTPVLSGKGKAKVSDESATPKTIPRFSKFLNDTLDHSDSPSTRKKKKPDKKTPRAATTIGSDVTHFVSPNLKRVSPILPDQPPPLRVTAPLQVPLVSKYGGDLSKFWSSFRYVDDSETSLERALEAENHLLRTQLRIDQKRRQGTTLTENLAEIARRPPRTVARPKDHRDHLLDAVVTSAHLMRQAGKNRLLLARKVSKMVAAHWERQWGSTERERKAEEKHLRALAKWTVREVNKQWKLAVNVVKAGKIAAQRAQKEKKDKEQLNAILEKSTQMLKKQQEEMIRLDSESEQSYYSHGDDEEEALSGTDMDASDVEEEQENPTQLLALEKDPTDPEVTSDHNDDSEADVDESIHVGETESCLRRSEPNSLTKIKADNGALQGFTRPLSPPPSTRCSTSQRGSVSGSTTPQEPAVVEFNKVPAHADGSDTIRPSRKSHTKAPALIEKIKDDKVDLDNIDFTVTEVGDAEEDAELERQMWEEEEEGEEEDSEDDGLLADADIPIEELLRRYGHPNAGGSEKDAEEEEEEEQEDNDSEDENKDLELQHKDETEEPELILKQEIPDDTVNPPATYPNHSIVSKKDRRPTLATAQDDMATVNLDQEEDDPETETDQHESESESIAISSRLGSRRSHTRASSAISSDRNVGRSRQPFLLRGQLRPYQQIGFEWLAGLYSNGVNGILADEMGLGKTIQTISLLAHLACDKGVWGPHLVIAPTSVMLNWEVEFKKFLPGFKTLSYFGNQKERKEKRIGWNTDNSFNVCITSYQIVLADQHIFRRKPWVYLILDEAHHIKNFRSQRWQTLLGFNSQCRLLLTGTPLQNNLMDLWSLLYFLMPHGVADVAGGGGAFANMKDFQDWFSNPLDKAIEGGHSMDEETRAMVSKLHTVLRPYLLRRLKSQVEKELPRKYEHVITCRLSKRQRFLYNDFMSRAKTRESLASGNYLSIINCLMQLRKVCNHPDLFEVRPIVTSFAMQRSVVADFEIKELLVRRRLLQEDVWGRVNLDVVNLNITSREDQLTPIMTRDLRKLNASKKLAFFKQPIPPQPEIDTWTLDGFRESMSRKRQIAQMEKWKHIAYINQYRCTRKAIFGKSVISLVRKLGEPKRLLPAECYESDPRGYLDRCDSIHTMVQSLPSRREMMQGVIDRFAFATPRAVAVDMPGWTLPGLEPVRCPEILDPEFDSIHPVAVKLHIAFPDASLLQYDCGKLQQLDMLMRRLKEGGHRILIFTQMTKVLDILEAFLNFHGYRYLRLDGATKVEQRQALTEKFNRDLRISAFILSTRSGGLGINLTGADTVLFYDLDWNAAIESQCMDRAHRIGQTRDVHIYRFVTEHTIEENMLRKANQKRLLDNMVIQEGEFNTDSIMKLKMDWRDMLDEGGKTIGGIEVGIDEKEASSSVREVEHAFMAAEDEEDREAAKVATREMQVDIQSDFLPENENRLTPTPLSSSSSVTRKPTGDGIDDASGHVDMEDENDQPDLGFVADDVQDEEEEDEEGGTIDDYMLKFVESDWEFFG